MTPLRRALVALFAACSLLGQEPPWRAEEVAGIEEFPGSDAAKELLLKQGFVVIDRLPQGEPGRSGPPKQVFSAYIDPNLPSFVTADLLLDAYAKLLQNVVAAMERRQVPQLLSFSRELRRVAQELGTDEGMLLADLAEVALALQGERPEDASERSARMRGRLHKLGEGIRPIFESELRPVAAYADDPALAAHFRSRRFWEHLRFDLREPKGRALGEALVDCLAKSGDLRQLHRGLLDPWDVLLGPSAALGPDAPPRELERAWTMTMLPACQTPLQEMSTRVSLPPTGLIVLAAGPMASEAGRRIWRASVAERFRDTPSRIGPLPTPDSHYGRLLKTLALLQRPDRRAAALFRSKPWQDLQAFTQLGCWAQARHVFALQAELATVMCMTAGPEATVVSPYPKLFARLAVLSGELRKLWRESSLSEAGLAAAQDDLRVLAEHWSEPRAPHELGEGARLLACAETLWEILEAELEPLTYSDAFARTRSRALAACAAEPSALPAEDRKLLEAFALGRVETDLAELANLCDQIATIADKQLEGTELGPRELETLKRLGESVARLHGYLGNSWLLPNDDHPRITPVARVAGVGDSRIMLHVGVARPEALYLVLPLDGRPTLYIGAVLSYREMAGRGPSTDAAWQELVRRGKAPPPPRFTDSFRR